MKIVERSYSGKIFRPRPEVLLDESSQLFFVCTSWGQRSTAKKSIQVIKDYFMSLQQDKEVTSPFSRLSCLSPLANNLRIAIKLANDTIYNNENKNEYTTGIELFVLARAKFEVAWAQIGLPCPILIRSQIGLMPIGNTFDLSLEHSVGRNLMSPLPNQLLGLDLFTDFSIQTFRPQTNDRLIVTSRSCIPPKVWQAQPQEQNLEYFSKIMSQAQSDLPFWIGLLDLN